MDAHEILSQLKILFEEISSLRNEEHSLHLVNSTKLITERAIYLIINYPANANVDLVKVKSISIGMLHRASEKNNISLNNSLGYYTQNLKKVKVEDFEFINPVYGALDYFINAVEAIGASGQKRRIN